MENHTSSFLQAVLDFVQRMHEIIQILKGKTMELFCCKIKEYCRPWSSGFLSANPNNPLNRENTNYFYL
jgi:hypothetical protein